MSFTVDGIGILCFNCKNCHVINNTYYCGLTGDIVEPYDAEKADNCENFVERFKDLSKRKNKSFCDRYMSDIDGKYLNILGHKWEIEVVKFKEHEYLKKHDAEGVTKQYLRKIIISDGTDKELLNEEERLNRFKHCLRHEIIHAFLSESGLGACSNKTMRPWAKNEEMVDWMAYKSIDIFRIFESLDLLD